MSDPNKNGGLDGDLEAVDRDDFADEMGNGGNGARPSLKETWESNPLLKVAALVLGGAVLVGGYLSIFGGGETVDDKAVIVSQDLKSVSATPGLDEVDPEYRKALEERNAQEAARALEDGSSAVPVPIGTPEESGLNVPDAPNAEQADPLTAWRREAESRRQAMEQQVIEEDTGAAPPPDIVPMVQPVRPQPQQVARANPEAPKELAAQMRVILAAQAPVASKVSGITEVKSPYTLMKEEEERLAQLAQTQQATGVNASGQTVDATGAPIVDKVILSAGSIVYGQLMNQLNSDLPGPVLVSLLSGPFAGGRAIGQLEVRQDFMVLTFKKVIKDGVVYEVEGVALDEETTLTGMRSDVDRHYFSRIILPAAAEFIKGYAQAAAETGSTTTTTAGGGVVQDDPEPDANEEFLSGVEEGADKASEILEENADRPITVHLDKGTTLGILFVESVTTASAQ